jgi:hypothetical protein
MDPIRAGDLRRFGPFVLPNVDGDLANRYCIYVHCLIHDRARGMGCMERRHDNSHGCRHNNSHGHKNEYLGAPPVIEVNPPLSSY